MISTVGRDWSQKNEKTSSECLLCGGKSGQNVRGAVILIPTGHSKECVLLCVCSLKPAALLGTCDEQGVPIKVSSFSFINVGIPPPNPVTRGAFHILKEPTQIR